MHVAFTPDHPLLHLAIVLTAGVIGGELVGRIRLPKVTGWIFTGIVLRALEPHHSVLTGLTSDAVAQFDHFVSFVLGYIAFTVGAALHFASLRNSGTRLGLLMLGEATITPSVIALTLLFLGGWIAPEQMTFKAALLLAAVGIAGAPGTTVLVVQEARARGILTRTLVAAVALIDMVAVGVFIFAAAYLGSASDETASWSSHWSAAIVSVAREFGLALLAAAFTALTALLLIRTIVGPAFLGPIMVAVILGAWGGASGLEASGILACTFAGIILSNLRHDTVRSAEAYLHSIGGVLFAGFYTFAGTKLDFTLVLQASGLVALFFLARLAGKYTGAFAAMSLADVPVRVRNYFGLALLPHGGVAVGLILLVESTPALQDVAGTVTTVGMAALAVNQLLGPSVTRFSLDRAGEAGKDRRRLLDFLDENHISVDVTGTNKEDVIRLLAAQLYTTQDRPEIPLEEFVEKVLEREELETTCLSRGLMIPHAELDEGQEITGILGISSKGLKLGAPDGHRVHAILLLATPKADHKRHLEVLAAFAAAITRDVNLREQLYHARTAAHAYNVLHADEAEDINYFLDDAIARVGASGGPGESR
ncbi:MAG: PTS fructose transporter subunit IIA [Planctomycetota bacterium]|nr:MAG: PTS fructose transporter subunit IIA [Planctomycetota bacterium]REJ96597.1 MAG: PTS fructose transporter subunit IIA [Planctomycetota bacterium]REK24743.1 MAG: PTS fructose transporter subunit IIA [Planctomycetota bacterium]REK37818.1 MAG: PTS fructose transporter subunit IIA [Planctomycetota bacterium]